MLLQTSSETTSCNTNTTWGTGVVSLYSVYTPRPHLKMFSRIFRYVEEIHILITAGSGPVVKPFGVCNIKHVHVLFVILTLQCLLLYT